MWGAVRCSLLPFTLGAPSGTDAGGVLRLQGRAEVPPGNGARAPLCLPLSIACGCILPISPGRTCLAALGAVPVLSLRCAFRQAVCCFRASCGLQLCTWLSLWG